MQVGWMPASSPGGTAERYDACNLFLLLPIFFPPLDQLLLIPKKRRRRAREDRPGVMSAPEISRSVKIFIDHSLIACKHAQDFFVSRS